MSRLTIPQVGYQSRLNERLSDDGLDDLPDEGHRVVVISESLELVLEAWCITVGQAAPVLVHFRPDGVRPCASKRGRVAQVIGGAPDKRGLSGMRS